jgi:lsr operon transcriptional repressor
MATRRDDEGQRGEELLLRVAWLYYKDELTQDEIARMLSMSRASVGRMLDRARRVGLVSITLNAEHLASFELASRLRETFALSEALVLPDYDGQPAGQRAMNARLGLGGAQYLGTHLRSGGSVGVGWGDTVSRVVAAADIGSVGPIHLVTLTGGVDGYLRVLSYSRAEREALTASVIPSPIVASTPALAAALRAEPTIQQVLELARSLKLAVVGVGTATPDSTLVQMGYLSAADARALTEKGVVGDILGQFFDIDGVPLDLPLHELRIGIDLEDLRGIGRVIGVAGGAAKTEAILGALRGGYLDVLVTNEGVARRLIELA